MKNILTGKVLIAMVADRRMLLLCGSLAYILLMRPAAAASSNLDAATSALTIIPAPSSTPLPLPPTLTPLPPTPLALRDSRAGSDRHRRLCATHHGGVGSPSAHEPGLNADFFSAFDSEVFLVTKGPQQADGYTWWYLTASYDAARSGWAAQDFLAVIPSP